MYICVYKYVCICSHLRYHSLLVGFVIASLLVRCLTIVYSFFFLFSGKANEWSTVSVFMTGILLRQAAAVSLFANSVNLSFFDRSHI